MLWRKVTGRGSFERLVEKKDEKDRNSAYSKVCCKLFNIGTGGIDSVRHHANGKRQRFSSSNSLVFPLARATIESESASSWEENQSLKQTMSLDTVSQNQAKKV